MVNTFQIIVIVLLVLVSALLIFLKLIERKMHKKQTRNLTKNEIYLRELEMISSSNPKKELEKINKLAIDFFREAFKIRKFIGHSELQEKFRKKKNIKAEKFSRIMEERLYSARHPLPQENMQIKNLLEQIIKENRIITAPEKKQKKESFLDKIKIFGINKKKLNN